MKKKVISVMLAAAMVAAMTAGCGSKEAETEATEAITEAGTDAAEDESVALEDETASGDTFTVGFDQDFPPMGFVGEDGEFTGFDLELAAKWPAVWGKKWFISRSHGIQRIWSWNPAPSTVSGTALP